MNVRVSVILILFALLINCDTIYGQAQEFSKSSIKIGFGIGLSDGDNFRLSGAGLIYTVGYQREIWEDRLRFNPNFSIGNYSAIAIDGGSEQYFNAINIATNLYYDLIKIKAFSLFLGGGGLLNTSRGLIDRHATPTSEYVRAWHFGGYFGTGLRINPSNRRTVVNIIPINIHLALSTAFLPGFFPPIICAISEMRSSAESRRI